MATYISGCPGIGKTTVARALVAKGTKNVREEQGLGYHPDNDRMRWFIDTTKLRGLIRSQPDLIFLSISSNWQEVGKLPWDKKLFLSLPWEEAVPRIVSRVIEKKNTWPANAREWLDTRQCYQRRPNLFRAAGFTEIDARGTADEVVERILNQIPITISVRGSARGMVCPALESSG